MRLVFYALTALFLASCTQVKQEEESEKGLDLNALTEKTELSFYAADSLEVTADYYPNKDARKVIIMFHQADFSRGEYATIAPKMVEAGYACLAVDLRSGNHAREVINETHNRALKLDLRTKFIDSKQDMVAAINFVKENLDKQIVLWGSSFSASLSLMLAKNDPKIVQAVVFSPGEYLGNQNTVKQAIAGMEKPVFVSCTPAEKMITDDVIRVLPEQYLTVYAKAVDHGSKSVWPEKANSDSVLIKVIKFL